MKTIQTSAYLFLIALTFVLTSCGKKTEDVVNPDAGAQVAGSYSADRIRTPTGQIGAITGAKLTILVTRLNETQVTLALRSVPTGKASQTIEFPGSVDLKRSGKVIDFILSDGSKVGNYNDGTLELEYEDPTLAGTLIGKKQ